MTHYTRAFNKSDRKQNDKDAIAECRSYLSTPVWEALLYEMGRAYEAGTAQACLQIAVATEFVGIRGYPFHALARCYFLPAYRAWMLSGDDPIELDADHFPIYPKDKAG